MEKRAWANVLKFDNFAKSAFNFAHVHFPLVTPPWYSLDTPMALVALGAQAATMACEVAQLLERDSSVSRRPHTIFTFGQQQPGAECLGAAPVEPEAARAAAMEVTSCYAMVLSRKK